MEITRARYSYKQRSKKSRFKLALLFLVILVFGSSAGGYTVLALKEPLPDLSSQISFEQQNTAEPVGALAWPSDGQAAFGTVRDGLLAGTSNQRQRPMASITKVVTALAVLEKMPLEPGQSGPTFVITQADIDSYARYVSQLGSVMPVSLGQELTQAEALAGMLLPSANNIADGLARWVFGSTKGYLTYANAMLDKLGLEDTVVADASGFSPGSKSTPNDLVRLGQKAMSNPTLAAITALKQTTIPGTGIVRNTNLLLSDTDAIGIKTGSTDEAGTCLLFAYRFGPSKDQVFIGAVMGQPSYGRLFEASRRLKDSALSTFKTVEVLPAGSVVGQITSPWGGSTDLVNAEPLVVYGWKGDEWQVEVKIEQVGAPILQGQVVGSAAIAGQPGTEVKVSTRSALDKPDKFWRLTNYL